MNESDRIIEELRKRIRIGYGEGSFSESDNLFKRLVEIYHDSSQEVKQLIRARISDDMSMLILGFSDRFSVLAARLKRKELLLIAISAHVLEGFTFDDRENIIRIGLINHVAKKIGIPLSELILQVSDSASGRVKEGFDNFLKRSEEMNHLNSFGIKEIETEEGVDYVPID